MFVSGGTSNQENSRANISHYKAQDLWYPVSVIREGGLKTEVSSCKVLLYKHTHTHFLTSEKTKIKALMALTFFGS